MLNIDEKVKVNILGSVGNGEIGVVTTIQKVGSEILYTLSLEKGFDNGGCLPIQYIQVKEGQYTKLESNTNTCDTSDLQSKLEAAQKEIKCLAEVHQAVEKIAFELYEKLGVESSDAAIKIIEKLKPIWEKYGVLK